MQDCVLRQLHQGPQAELSHDTVLVKLDRPDGDSRDPGPKTEVADWYQSTVLESLWRIPPERFTSQAFWDCFDQIQLSPIGSDVSTKDELDRAQLGLLALWKDKQLVSHRLLSYDTTNFYTFVASTNQRNTLAQRGHNKQGRHNLRQVGLSYVLDGVHGLSLCHHVYPGNLPDTDEFSVALPRLLRFLDDNQIPRESVTLVFDKGSAALYNTLVLDGSDLGWISALPWNQAPREFREMPLEQLKVLSSDQPGVQACQQKLLVHGKERLCVLKYSVPFLSEQIHSLSMRIARNPLGNSTRPAFLRPVPQDYEPRPDTLRGPQDCRMFGSILDQQLTLLTIGIDKGADPGA